LDAGPLARQSQVDRAAPSRQGSAEPTGQRRADSGAGPTFEVGATETMPGVPSTSDVGAGGLALETVLD
jgi:hypothetical protein